VVVIDPVEMAKVDQAEAFLVEFYPPLLEGFVGRLQERGFSREEAVGLAAVLLSSLVNQMRTQS
jgi:hypothetical protein